MIPIKGFMFGGLSDAIIPHYPVLAISLAGEEFYDSSQPRCAFSTVKSLSSLVEGVRGSLSECWIGSVPPRTGLCRTGLSWSEV